MKKVFLNVWKKALVLSFAAITFVITACGEDSGLGSTVDTEAPKIEITYPPLGANIRGTFVLAGSCDDDKSVKSIIVTVTDTTTKKVVGTVPASIENGGKSWKAKVNNYSENDKKYDYLDGNYQFTAEIHDGAGHKNSASRTFDLDNTAPVFVASNPGVIKSQNKKASAYGSIFTIDGTIADDHTIASLTAKIFDENGNLIGNYKEEDIATAGGTSVTIASHYVDKGDGTAKTEQNDRYTQIYGDNDEAGTKQYYCTVLVEDSTKSYTNPGESENTTSGNITSEIYLYDSVYKSLMSTKSGNRYGLSAADFMTLLNGTRAKDEKTETALKILKEVVVDTGLEAESDKDANKLSFSLNPMANPTYSVNGFAVSKDSAGNAVYKEAFSDSTVVVSVNAGLDKTAILPGNLKVWTVLVDGLSPEDAQKRVNLVANKVTALQKIHSTVDEVHERAEEIIDGAIKYADKEFGVGSLALVKDNSDDTGASVQTETLSCVLPKDTYISGKVYAFIVTGYDEDDVAFLHNTLYAFKANEAGIAPTLIITEPVNQSYIKTTEGLVFKGETSLPEGSTLKVSSLKINLHVQDENKQNLAVGKQDGYKVDLIYNETSGYSSTDESLTYDPSTKIWTFTPSKLADYKDISANEGEGKSYFYTLDITSESSSGNAASKTLSVHIDATLPKVTISNVTPCVSGKTFYSESGENIRNYVNGDISVKFNIEETNLKDVSYKVLVDEEEKVASTSLGRLFSGSIDLDTTKWSASATEKKDFEVIITAVDTCGNTTSYSTTEYNTVTYNKSETETATFNKPIIICQETDIPQIKFNNTAELSYTTEKDGETVEHSFLVYDEPKDATEEQKAEIAKKNAENKKSIVATHNLFNIENNNTIQIALEDDDNIASAKVVLYDEAGKLYEADGFENPSTLQVNKTSHTWNYVLPSKEGIYQIYVEVTDTKLKDDLSETVKLWRKNSVGKFFVAVDAGAPTVEIKTPVANSYQKVAFAASGTVSEKANITLERAIYKTGTDPKFVDVTGKIGAEKDGKYPWDETAADIKDLSDGDYILSYRATDRYEQSSTVSVNVKVDTKAPEFLDNESSVYVAADAQAGKTYVESTWYNNEAINIKGKFLEANGISNIYYWLDKDVGSLDTATGSFTAVTEEEKNDKGEVERVVSSYKTTIPGFTECSIADAHKLTLVAVDLAGNESEKIEYPSIKVDMTPPTFENYYYKMGTVKGEVIGNILTNGENDVTLYGLISDGASGVDVNKLVLNVVAGTTKSILADTQTVKNITFTAEPTSWTEGEGANQKTVNVGTTEGFEKWIEKADAATATTFKDGDSIEDATKITGWKAVISKDSFKTGDVRTDYFDKAGNGNNNYKMFSIRVDKDSPELKNYSLKDEKAGYSAYKTKDFTLTVGTGDEAKKTELPHYYVNNGTDHTFALEGIATDNEGISKVELVDSTGVIKTSEKGEFKWTGISLSRLDSDDNITIKITDIANNVFEQKIHITPDATAPAGMHSSGPVDNYFRIGDAENAGVSDVGAGLSAETYGKDSTLKIRGYFAETGSGLSMIYYKLFSEIPTAADIEEFKNDYEGKKGGYFSPLDAEETRTIGTEEIKTNFKTSIPGFKEGKNYLVLIAVDKVGNYALDTCRITNGTSTLNGCYEIKVDMTQPRFERFYYKMGAISAEVKGDILTNGENNVTLYGLISDADSGVDVNKLVLNVVAGTTKSILADTQTVRNITFTTEPTSWTEGEGASQETVSVGTTEGFEKWIEKADAATATTFKDGDSIEDATKITGWKAVISKNDFKTGEVRADYYDKAGNNSQNIKMFSVRVDQEKPKLNNHTLSAEKKAGEIIGYKAYKTKDFEITDNSVTPAVTTKIPHYYVNNSDGHTFSLSGVATDNEGVAKVELVGAEGKSADKGEFSWSSITLPELDQDGNITIKITDIANNEFEQKIHITIDTQAPSGVHDTESVSKGKDTIFRVGDADNLLEEIKTSSDRSSETVLTTADKDVGGKYAPGTYGKSNSIKIRGQFKEEGSGLKEIYYKIFKNTPPSETDITNFVNDYENLKDGVFAPLSSKLDDPANDKRLVKVNMAKNAWRYDEIQSNYKMAIAGFGEGNNYLVVAAVDNVGNIALDNVTYTYMPGNSSTAVSLNGCYSINVDTVTPELVDDSVKAKIGTTDKTPSGILTNFADGDITLAGVAEDADSGVEKVVLSVKVGSENKTVKATLSAVEGKPTQQNWKADIDDAWFTGIESGNFTVYASVTDKAGMEKTLSVATIIVDTKLKEVKLEKPADADTSTKASGIQINGIINLKGTIDDENVLPATAIKAIEYKEKDASDSDWTSLTADSQTAMPNLALSGNYTFYATSFDTRALTDGHEYYIRARGVDSANNEGLSDEVTANEVLVKVDQDTDRPVIKITTLDSNDEPTTSLDVLQGTVSDDDGVSKFEYTEKENPTEEDWTEITLNSGSWRIEDLASGKHQIKFRVTDSAGTVFETSKASYATGKQHFTTTGYPYVAYGKNDKIINDAVVSFAVDLNAPKIESLAVASTVDTTAPVIPATIDETHPDPYKASKKKSFGANARYMWLKVLAKEDVALNPIEEVEKDVTLKVGSATIDVTGNVSRTGDDYGLADTDAGFTYIIGPIDTSTFTAEGDLTVALVINDKSKRASDAKTANIYIDMTAPEVTVTSPNVSEGKSSDSIIGTTVLRGEIRDTSNSSTIAKFFYMIPTQAQIGTSGIFKDLNANGKGYTFNSEHGWKDLKEIETSKAGVVNDYRDHTSMLWEIPIKSSKFKDLVTADGLSLIYYATAKTGTGDTSTLTYAEEPETAIPSSVSNGSDGKNCVYVPLYFYTEDETGMSKVTATKILVDPYAGIPRLEITTPENFAKTGGNLNFQGSAFDDAGDLEKVVLEKLEVSCKDAVEATIESVTDWKTMTADILKESADIVTKALRATDGTIDPTAIGDDGSIIADGKASWKISVNLSAISDDSLKTLFETTTVPEIKIARATFVAYDTNGTKSTFKVTTLKDEEAPLVTNIFVDKNAPRLSNVQLVQYAATPTEATLDTSSLSRSYSAGMYISHNNGNGDWYLKGTITDDASVEGFTITSGTSFITLEGKAENGKTATGGIITSGLGTTNCTFIIPLTTDSSEIGTKTQFYPTIELDDGQHTDVTQNLSFNVDNTAPGMYLNGTTNAVTTISDEAKATLRLKDFNGLVVGENNVVENSNGSYSFGDMVVEEGSGVAYVAVWFEKTKAGTKRWYNSIVPAGVTAINHGGEGVTIDGTTVKVNTEGLPVKELTDCAREAPNTIGKDVIATDHDIGVGSLVKIGGSYHLITEKSGGTITIDDDVDTSIKTIELVYANIVNHRVTEGFNADWTVSNDDGDGDGFVEMLKQSGSNYQWQATLRSDFIPDGPATIHVVAFDEAGNVNSGYVATSIQNNRPRISKVFLGTDLNGNGTFDYFSETSTGAVAAINELTQGYAGNGTEFGELSFYSALSSDGKIQGTVTLKSSNFVAKDGLLVLPEIIGGNTDNGDLKYLYKVADTEAGATSTTVDDTVTNGSSTLTDLWTELAADTVKINTTGLSALPLANKAGTAQPVTELLAANTKADKWNYYQTTTTDYKDDAANTHGGVVTGQYKGLVLNTATLTPYESWTSTAGVETKSVKYFAFTIWDATEGTTQGKDSLYALLKIPMVVNVVDDIAPKAVIHPFYWNSKEDGSFCYDADGVAEGHIDIDNGTGTDKPGVSGKVWIKATVTDETRLSSATLKLPNGTDFGTVATYTGGNWVEASSLPANVKAVEFLDTPEPNQSGHSMTFRVAVDMTSYGLARNMTVDVGATDKMETPSVAQTVQTIDSEKTVLQATQQTIDPDKTIYEQTKDEKGKLTSHYIMDFVPYIKSIYPATESSASRSRLGKFPVQAGKEMIIEGMNFAAGATYRVSFYKTGEDQSGTETEESKINWGEYKALTGTEDGKITVDAPEYSRWVKVWIKLENGWIGTMNNENVDYGCNIEEGYVPSDDNGKGNQDLGLKRANDAGTNFWTDDRYISVWNSGETFGNSANASHATFMKYSLASKKYLDGSNYADVSADKLVGWWVSGNSQWDSVYGGKRKPGVSGTADAGFKCPPGDIATCLPVMPEGDYNDYYRPFMVLVDNSYNDTTEGNGLSVFRDSTHYTWNSSGLDGYTIDTQPFKLMNTDRFVNLHIASCYSPTEDLGNAPYNQSVQDGSAGVYHVYVSYYDSFAHCLKYAALAYSGKYADDKEKTKKYVSLNSVYKDSEKTGSAVVAGCDIGYATTSFTDDAGEWNAIVLDTTDENTGFSEPIPIIAYYDKTEAKLKIARGKQTVPVVSGRYKATAESSVTDVNTNGWYYTTVGNPNGSSDFGRYVSMEIDSKGGLHIAAQDATNGKLYYGYFTLDGTEYKLSSEGWSIVDSTSSVGRWTAIKLEDSSKTGLAAKPVIAYQNASKLNTKQAVKIAYVNAVTSNAVTTYYWDAITDVAEYEAKDTKLNLAIDALNISGTKEKYAVGMSSSMFAVDFMRGEE